MIGERITPGEIASLSVVAKLVWYLVVSAGKAIQKQRDSQEEIMLKATVVADSVQHELEQLNKVL